MTLAEVMLDVSKNISGFSLLLSSLQDAKRVNDFEGMQIFRNYRMIPVKDYTRGLECLYDEHLRSMVIPVMYGHGEVIEDCGIERHLSGAVEQLGRAPLIADTFHIEYLDLFTVFSHEKNENYYEVQLLSEFRLVKNN